MGRDNQKRRMRIFDLDRFFDKCKNCEYKLCDVFQKPCFDCILYELLGREHKKDELQQNET